ncbi:MAG: FeoA domain-containing protein [Trueperaceae bacterium]|nr:FeoA domain-containing protein [Trueperaceae bacterium]
MNSDRAAWECAHEPTAASEATAPCCVRCPLSSLQRGACARVVSLAGAPRLRRRLMALGIRPSAELAVLGRAPNRGPLELRAGTVHLMLREHEARDVLVELADAEGRYALPTL